MFSIQHQLGIVQKFRGGAQWKAKSDLVSRSTHSTRTLCIGQLSAQKACYWNKKSTQLCLEEKFPLLLQNKYKNKLKRIFLPSFKQQKTLQEIAGRNNSHSTSIWLAYNKFFGSEQQSTRRKNCNKIFRFISPCCVLGSEFFAFLKYDWCAILLLHSHSSGRNSTIWLLLQFNYQPGK